METNYILQPWQRIAGCSQGTTSEREVVVEMLETLDYLAKQVEAQQGFEIGREANKLWRELAAEQDETVDAMDYGIDFAEIVNDLLPPSCTMLWEDNEFRVTPYVDDEIPRFADFDDIPDDFDDTEYYIVNDHGNVAYYVRHDGEFVMVWDMV